MYKYKYTEKCNDDEQKYPIMSSLSARNYVYILNGCWDVVGLDDRWTPGSVVRVLHPTCD